MMPFLRKRLWSGGRISSLLLFVVGTLLLAPLPVFAAVTSVTPITWNIVGLDSNDVNTGPNRFPVGARVCSSTNMANVPVTFTWDSSNSYIRLVNGLPGDSPSETLTLSSIPAGGCADAYFEVAVSRSSAAYDSKRGYHISAGGLSTPIPRELYVEHLVSQARNAISNIEYRAYGSSTWTSVGPGSSFALVKGEIYEIRLNCYTATQGYEQLESFSTLPNTIFQLQRVDTTYTADTTTNVSSPNDMLYGDACSWENNPSDPNYMACNGEGKIGGTISVTYRVKILALPSGGTPVDLFSLIYDFSGSSFHYNSDYDSGGRGIIIVDPASARIDKSFSPNPINVTGISTLTFTLSNNNAAPLSGATFIDNLPANMTVADPTGASTSNCGTPTFAPAAGATSLSFSNGTIPANGSCTVKVNVNVSTAASYVNTSNNLFIGATDTGDSATATLIADTTTSPPVAPPSACPGQEVTLATWTMETSQGTGTPPNYTPGSKHADVATATASFNDRPTYTNYIEATTAAYGNPLNSWAATGWYDKPTSGGGFPAAGTPPYYQFTLDTRKFNGITVSTNYLLMPNGDWGNPGDNMLYAYAQANTEPGFTTVLNTSTTKNTPYRGPVTSTPYATTGATTSTVFRINGTGASKSTGVMYLDNITFRGCRRPDPPTLTKAFSPNPVAVNGTSTLTFTVTNPNSANALNGITFTDTLPSGVTVTSGTSSQCGGTLTTTAPSTISFSGGTRAAGSAACSITATVTATTTGPHDNISSIISADESGPNNTATGIATASLVAVSPPVIAKQFAPNPILAGGVSTLTFIITNPNSNQALSGVAFSDTFPTSPGNMVVAATPRATTGGCGAPTFTPAAGAGSINFSGGAIAAGGICTISVDITAPTVGAYNNTSGSVSHLLNGPRPGNTASDTLTVDPPSPAIALLKQVGASAAGPWASGLVLDAGSDVYYQFTVENVGDVPLTNIGIIDPLVSTVGCSWPANLPVADAFDSDHIATCTVGPLTAQAGSHPNTAHANGTYSGTVYSSPDSTASYSSSDLTLTKTATEAYFLAVGGTLTYTYYVNNTGTARFDGPLTVTVTDNKISSVNCTNAMANTIVTGTANPGIRDGNLYPGESAVCTATYTVTASDMTAKQVTNTARANITNGTTINFNTPVASETVPLGPDLRVTKSNNVGGNAYTSTPFTWTLTASNAAGAGSAAAFANGQTLLTDNLPSSGATYSAPATATNAGGTSGTIACSISGNNLACTASGPVSIPAGGSFSIAVTVTPTAAGALVNPRAGGICKVDPTPLLVEMSETNNDCADTVTVTTPALALLKSADRTYFSAAGETVNYSYAVRNTGGAGLTPPAALSVTDSKIATVTCPALSTAIVFATGNPGNGDNTLDPGEQVTCSGSYTVQASDVTAGMVTNNATATVGAASSPQASVTVFLGAANVTLVKASANLGPTGYSIPGETVRYTLVVTNADSHPLDGNSLMVVDQVPANTSLVTVEPAVTLSNNPAVTGLTLTYGGLGDTADQVEFSTDGTDFSYLPVNSGGVDPNVTHIRYRPTGSMNGGGSSFTATFKVRIK